MVISKDRSPERSFFLNIQINLCFYLFTFEDVHSSFPIRVLNTVSQFNGEEFISNCTRGEDRRGALQDKSYIGYSTRPELLGHVV